MISSLISSIIGAVSFNYLIITIIAANVAFGQSKTQNPTLNLDPIKLYQKSSFQAADFSVQEISHSQQFVRYQVKLPDGSLIDLDHALEFPSNMTQSEKNAELDYYIKVLNGFAKGVYSGHEFDYAFRMSDSNTFQTITLNKDYLKSKSLTSFDPFLRAFRAVTYSRYSSESAFQIDRISFFIDESAPAKVLTIVPKDEKPQNFIKKTLNFLLDAMVLSTKRAWSQHKSGEKEIHNTWTERGIQLGIKFEFMIGVGRINIARAVGASIMIGYNRAKKTIVLKRGFRVEKMADGGNLSIGGRLEIKQYRVNSEKTYSQENTFKGYNTVRGQTWYPPMFIPFVSAILETGNGGQNEGITIGWNFADIGGSFLLNTVNSYEENRRVVYQVGLPDPAKWMSDFIEKSESFLLGPKTRGIRSQNSSFFMTNAILNCDGIFVRIH